MNAGFCVFAILLTFLLATIVTAHLVLDSKNMAQISHRFPILARRNLIQAPFRFQLLACKFFSLFRINSWGLALKGILPAVEHSSVLKSLNSVDVLIDVGANRGQFSLIAQYILSPSRLILFEPIPRLLDPFKAFVRRKHTSQVVEHYEFALSDRSVYSCFNVAAKSDCSSLLSPTDHGIKYSSKSSDIVGQIPVRLDLMDNVLADFFDHNNALDVLVKIDVQGFELSVIKGAERFFREKVSYAIIEVSTLEHYRGQCTAESVIEQMSYLGFEPLLAYNAYIERDGGIQYADILFARRTYPS